MLTLTQEFLDDCKGFVFHPLESENVGMLADDARINWWIDVGPGRRRAATWRNAQCKPIPRATAEILIAATVALSGGLELPDGSIADLDEEMNIVPRS